MSDCRTRHIREETVPSHLNADESSIGNVQKAHDDYSQPLHPHAQSEKERVNRLIVLQLLVTKARVELPSVINANRQRRRDRCEHDQGQRKETGKQQLTLRTMEKTT